MKKRVLALILCLTLCASLLAGCSGSTGGNTGNEDAVLQLPWEAMTGVDTIFENPYINHGEWSRMLFETPLSINADGSVVYKLASSVDVSADGLTYTFTMQDGAKWHDGEPVTAEDLAFSFWAMLADPKCNFGGNFMNIEGAQAVKDGADTLSGVSVSGNTAVVKLTSPNSLFLNAVAGYLFVLPAHCLSGVPAEELSTNEAYWSAPVGTGPYVFDEISFPDYFTMVRNPDYYRAPAGIAKAQFTNYTTGGADAKAAALIAGTLDFAGAGDLNEQAIMDNIAAQNKDVSVITASGTYLRQFLYNIAGPDPTLGDGNGHPDITDVRVREAINLLIDKEAIAAFYGAQANALTTLVNPSNPAYNSDIPLFERNVERAKQLLEDADFDFDHVLRVGYAYTDQTTADIMLLVKQNLEEAGMTVELCLAQGDLGVQIYDVRNYDIFYCGERMDQYVELYNVELAVNGYFDNMYGEKEQRQVLFNDLVTEYLATADTAKQQQLLDQLQLNNYQQLYIAPVYCLDTLYAYNAAHVQIPEGLFDIDCTSKDMRWEDWSMVG